MTYGVTKRLFLIEILPVVLLFVVPSFVHAGVFSTLMEIFTAPTEAKESVKITYNAQNVPLLKAAVHADPNPSKGGGDIIVDSGALVPDGSPDSEFVTSEGQSTNGEISVYVVREGDALSQIAEMFGVTTNTILWANDIKSADLIQPGDTLVILPITGVRHVVKSGDTLKSIAEKYEGDIEDIMAYNGLASADSIVPGDTVVIPGGEIAPPPSSGTRTASSASGPTVTSTGNGSSGYAHPVPGAVRSQGIHGYNGVDLAAPLGTSIRAAAAGQVILSRLSGWNGGYGNYIVIKHNNGTQTLYAHNNVNYVVTGQYVSQGEVIGTIGSTGRSTGNHLHFEVRGARNPF